MAKIENLDDGAVDHNGDLLPILSKSSSNVNIQKLLDAPLPDFSRETPGSPFWTKFGMFLLQQVRHGLFREDHVSGLEEIWFVHGTPMVLSIQCASTSLIHITLFWQVDMT